MERLGLPQTKHSKKNQGRTKFEGPLAPHCVAFYDATLEIQRKMAAAHFISKKDLRDKAMLIYEDITAQFISPLLDNYGPNLWPATNSTHADASDCSQRWIYNKEPDRTRFVSRTRQ